MRLFKSILVGIDPTLQRTDPNEPSATTREAVQWGIDLARKNRARIVFFSAVNTGDDVLWPLEEDDRSRVRRSAHEAADARLQKLVAQAQQEGIVTERKVVEGEAWLKLIQESRLEHHDLVIVGAQEAPEASRLHRFMFGSTAGQLIHSCPCPVLVSKPQETQAPSRSINVLVAADLGPNTVDLLKSGQDLAAQLSGRLHVLHVVQHHLEDVCRIGLPDAVQEEYRRKVRVKASEHLQSQLAEAGLDTGTEIHVADGLELPDVMIERFIREHSIDVVVVGSSGRHGIWVGHTAERLLPELPCSVLVIKPANFVSPQDL